MASSATLPKDVVEQIASQIGERLTGAAQQALSQSKGLTVAEAFPVWTLGLDATASADGQLSSLASATGYWHHQIRHGDDAIEYAKSRPLGPSSADWRLEEIVTSPIAKGIDDALKWIEANVRGDGEVRLLVVPAYFVHALWLLIDASDSIVIADMPRNGYGLQYNRLYAASEFVKILANSKYVTGLPQR